MLQERFTSEAVTFLELCEEVLTFLEISILSISNFCSGGILYKDFGLKINLYSIYAFL
jgi:hypothetical protein